MGYRIDIIEWFELKSDSLNSELVIFLDVDCNEHGQFDSVVAGFVLNVMISVSIEFSWISMIL